MTMHPSTHAIRVAIIGYGLGGRVFHAPLVASTPGLRLAAIVTGDAGRRANARREHPGARLLESTDALWEIAAELPEHSTTTSGPRPPFHRFNASVTSSRFGFRASSAPSSDARASRLSERSTAATRAPKA